jgi:alpha-tubulin suppressor-like RCC1 family protein
VAARGEGAVNCRGRGGLLVAALIVGFLAVVPGARADEVGSFLGAETLAAGRQHTCAILAEGEVSCWGADGDGRLDVPGGASETFASITAGGAFSCGVRSDGTVLCWGDDAHGQVSDSPTGTFLSADAGEAHACAVAIAGEMSCWGDDAEGQASPPGGTFLSVASGAQFSCGLRPAGQVACWGADGSGQATPPAGEFTAVAAGGAHACAIAAAGTLACWGDGSDGESQPPAGEFRSVTAGSDFSCAIAAAGEVECWGDDAEGQASPPSGQFRSVAAGGSHACGVRTDGETVCWGSDAAGQLDGVPSGAAVGVPLVAVGLDSHYSCAVRLDGKVQCWGLEFEGFPIRPGVPQGSLALALAGGIQNTCMIGAEGALECWGRETSFGLEAKPPSGTFTGLATANADYCALRADGELACWGDPQPAELTAPAGRFRTISAGQSVFCAIRDDGELACWGTPIGVEDELLAEVPAGTYRAVATDAEASSACAIRDDGGAACWGGDFHMPAEAPTGTFRDLAGVCPLDGELKLTCGGEGEVPAGHVLGAAATGERHSCALLADGTVDCWGENEEGQVRPELLEAEFPRAVIGSAYSLQLETTFEDPPAKFGSGLGGSLPPGLTLSEGGLIGGTPTTAGDFRFEAVAANGIVPPATAEEVLEVVGAPTVTPRPGAETTTSGASIDAEVDPENLPTQAWFEYWPATGSATEARRTATQEVPAGLEPVPISTQIDGLSPDTAYDYRAVARNEAGSEPIQGETLDLRTAATPPAEVAPPAQPPVATPTTALPTAGAQTSSAPPPVAGKSVDIEPTTGTVTVRCPDQSGSQKLLEPERIALGCVVDTRHGTATLTSVKGPGETESAEFWGGVFKVGQEGGAHPETVLTLVGPLDCGTAMSLAARPADGGRGLWGSGEGNFKTVGHDGSASVRGTIWFVGDRCDGSTLFKVRRGTVWVRDFGKRKTVVLQKGQSYVAEASPGRR